MNSLKKKTYCLLPFILFLVGCEFKEKLQKRFLPAYSPPGKVITENKEVSILCEKRNIDKYLVDGWEVVDQTSIEATCSWKSKPARRGCNMDKDKGCRIIVPDKIGKEVKYILERKKTISETN